MGDNPLDVAPRPLPGQRRLRGVLRQAEGRALPPRGLVGLEPRALRGRARALHRLVQLREAQVLRGRGLRHYTRQEGEAGPGGLARPGNLPHSLVGITLPFMTLIAGLFEGRDR